MNTEDFYKKTKPYLWNSDSPQKDEGFYGKEDMKRFAEEYHQAELKLLGIANVVGQSEQFICYKADVGNSRCSSQCRECGENECSNK